MSKLIKNNKDPNYYLNEKSSDEESSIENQALKNIKNDIKKLKTNFKNNIDIIHLQNQKIIGIKPDELTYSELINSITMGRAIKIDSQMIKTNNEPFYDYFIISN